MTARIFEGSLIGFPEVLVDFLDLRLISSTEALQPDC